jgi:hypothetical protein
MARMIHRDMHLLMTHTPKLLLLQLLNMPDMIRLHINLHTMMDHTLIRTNMLRILGIHMLLVILIIHQVHILENLHLKHIWDTHQIHLDQLLEVMALNMHL